ncbi:MAG TPA: response regulator [Blastocatellia bacterium]|nr:response regulator [Blastocatellia bacterium]
MKKDSRSTLILIADDDSDDRMMALDAFRENRLTNELRFVEDGQELMDFLRRKGRYTGLAGLPLPALILLDLNMPKKDGREALKEIKADPALRRIPIVVMSTSKEEEDIYRAYDLGVSSFITKPASFESLVEIVKSLADYWFDVVELPGGDTRH